MSCFSVVEPLSRPLPVRWRDSGRGGESGEADVQVEVPEPQVEYSAAGPVHDERKQDDGQDDNDHPEEEHDDAGDGIPRYTSRSSHGLPATRHCAGYSALAYLHAHRAASRVCLLPEILRPCGERQDIARGRELDQAGWLPARV